MRHKLFTSLVVAFCLASLGTPSSHATLTYIYASNSTNVFSFNNGTGGVDGSSNGSFISGFNLTTPARRLVFGADRDADGSRELYLGTDDDGLLVYDGKTGVFEQQLTGTASNLRQISYDPVAGDVYYGTFAGIKIGRRDSTAAPKPGAGFTIPNDTFVPTPTGPLTSVTVGPDDKVYVQDGVTLLRYSKAGGAFEASLSLGYNSGELSFGPDVTNDGKQELYISDFNAGVIRVLDVLTNPNLWSNQTSAVSGLVIPLGFDFDGSDMYIAEFRSGADARIDRYQLIGGVWTADPSVGNSGATFAFMANVQDVTILAIPEPSTLLLLATGGFFIWRRRRS